MYRSKGSRAAQRESAKYWETRRRKARKQADREARRKRREERQRREEEQEPASHEALGTTAAARYAQRQVWFAERYGRAGPLLHRAAWLVHNCVAHPLLGALPGKRTVRLHDRTADWLNLSPHPTASPVPALDRRRDWIVHNCVVHPAMGLAPRSRFFSAHESTADSMNVDGWV